MESSPLNLQMLEDYSGDLDKDQVHFTVWSGVNYVKHLVDRSVELLLQPAPVKNQRLILVLPIVVLIKSTFKWWFDVVIVMWYG